MAGVDAAETELLRGMLAPAERHISSFEWCRGIEQSGFGFGVESAGGASETPPT
jgi:hypothetical protein